MIEHTMGEKLFLSELARIDFMRDKNTILAEVKRCLVTKPVSIQDKTTESELEETLRIIEMDGKLIGSIVG
jgi:hypothetical protein